MVERILGSKDLSNSFTQEGGTRIRTRAASYMGCCEDAVCLAWQSRSKICCPRTSSTCQLLEGSFRCEVPGCNWIRHYDVDTRREYYYDKVTQESKFERPAVYATPRPPRWVVRYDEETGEPYYVDENAPEEEESTKYDENETQGGQLLQIEDSHWAKYYDEAAGKEYYYNWDTGESTYDRPDSLIVAAYDD